MDIIERAIHVAAKAHDGQYRKGTDIPYISHPYSVGLILLKAGCSNELVTAGILHDVLEDTDLNSSYLVKHFGENVTKIVIGCSEPNKHLPWEDRKKHTLEYLVSADKSVKTVVCADKLANIRTIHDEYKRIGDKVWERFNRGRNQQEWYYKGLINSLPNGFDQHYVSILDELSTVVISTFTRNSL